MSRFNPAALYMRKSIRQALDRIWHFPLTVVEAPMGYGKTTAVREYLNKTDAHVLWQMVYDNSPSSFWRTFSRLFVKLNEDSSQSLLQLGFPSDNILRREALRIIDKIELSGQTVLVIDDFHLIESPEVNCLIEFLTRHEIDNLHIILIARFTGLQSCEELMLKGYLHHIAKETFELSPKEIAAYYKACGIALKDNDADKLYSLTEGWISALYLLMLEFIATGSYTPENNIYKLMKKAVYQPLSEEIKGFLLTICIFDSFTQEQAVHMWGKDNTGEVLTEIINKNAFVKYDVRTKTYYAHNILTGFLKEELAGKGAQYKDDLYRKAARWFMKTGDHLAARRYYYACGDFDGVLFSLEEDRSNDFTTMNKELLKKYMDECPNEVKARHHYALLKYALHLFVHNETALFGRTCGEFSNNLKADASLDYGLRNRLWGELELLIGFTAYNDLKKMSAHHRKAWELLGQPTSVYDSGTLWTFGSPSVLYLYYRESGRLEEHVRDLKEALPCYCRLTNGHGSGAEYVMEAEWHFNAGDFETAEVSVHKALYKAQSGRQPNIMLCAIYLKIRLAFIKSDFGQMFELLHKMREDMTSKKEYHLIHMVEICESSIYAYLNQKHKIPEWFLKAEMDGLYLNFPAFGAFNITYGRVLLINGEYLKLIGSAEHFIGIASVFPNLLGHIYTYIYLSAANNKIFKEAEALASLKQALAIAVPDKLYMPFVENCDYIKPLLEKLYNDGHCREGIARILELYTVYQKAVEQIVRDHFSGESRKLTGRELEIARHAAEGITNKEIGVRLFITENTVKTQLKNVFEKLGINSRALLKQALDNLDK